jgi:hypothetical protein
MGEWEIKRLEKQMKILLDLFSHSGNCSKPYRDAGWHVLQVDIKHGIDILKWDYVSAIRELINSQPFRTSDHAVQIGIIAAIPCTDYAISGARHFAAKDSDGRTHQSNRLVMATKHIIDYCKYTFNLVFWQVENPMSRIHKLNPWLGSVKHKFNPCDYALFSPEPEKDRYNKQTWLWGEFNKPPLGYMAPIYKENPGWKLYGGKSERTKELRSITPMGFCYAFYIANSGMPEGSISYSLPLFEGRNTTA